MPEIPRGNRKDGYLALLLIGLASLGALLVGRRALRRWRGGRRSAAGLQPGYLVVPAQPPAAQPASPSEQHGPLPRSPEEPLAPRVAAARGVEARGALPAVLALSLAVIPSGLVVADRWLNIPEMRILGRETWCWVEALCQSALPGYFLYAVPALLGVLLLLLLYRRLPLSTDILPDAARARSAPLRDVRYRRRISRFLRLAAGIGLVPIAVAGFGWGRVPGWDHVAVVGLYLTSVVVDEAPLVAWVDRVRRRAPRWVSMALAQLGLVSILFGVHNEQAWACLLGAALGTPILFRWTQGERPPIAFWLVSVLVLLFSYRIDSWTYAVIGDDYAFFFYARHIAQDHGLREIGARLFSGQAVYGDHPYFSSLIQAASMALLGADNYGWRFSNGYLAALSAGLLYLFWNGFLSPRAAMAAAVLVGTSHYLINFSKIGYNNVQALFAAALVLWSAGAAVRSGSPLAFTGLGLAMGTCLYVYPAALYALPLPLLLLLLFTPPRSRESMRRWAMMATAFALLLLPLLFQPGYWLGKAEGTPLYDPILIAQPSKLAHRLWTNALYSFVSYFYSPAETHYVVSSYLDPLSAILVPIGLTLVVRRDSKARFGWFIALALLAELVLAGVTHGRQFPPTTRMFMLLPWWTALAALGLLWSLDRFAWLRGKRWPLLLSLSLIVGLNVYQAYGLFRQRWEGRGSLEVLFLRAVQWDARLDPDHNKLYLFLTEPRWGIDGLRLLRDVYGVPPSQEHLARVAVETPLLGPDVVSTIQREETVVIIQPWMEEGLRRSLKAVLRRLGKVECQVREGLLTRVVFSLWLSPAYRDLCWRANLP